MKWKVEFDTGYNLVVLTYKGLISPRELYEYSSATIELTNKHSVYKFFVEAKRFMTNATRGQVFKMPNELYAKWGMNKRIQIAVVEPKDILSKHIVHFYELASKNLGWDARDFPDQKAALKWLL